MNFELPRNVERYLATLSKLYAQEGQHKRQEIIVNSRIRVQEGWSYDNWNGGTCGHALYLALPESLYLEIVRDKDKLRNSVKNDINEVHNLQHEFVEEVFLELDVSEDTDWRRQSGLLVSAKRTIAPQSESRIWGDEGFRSFLSHKSEVKKQAAELKNSFQTYGVSCFVAHEDISPTKAWQDEIENALGTMDALVALLTERFSDSPWTDQEVGFAFGRGVPIVSVRLGKDPYGFIGKFQALTCTWEAAAREIVKLLVNHNVMLDCYIKAIRTCRSFAQGNTLAEILPSIDKLTATQANELAFAYNDNKEVHGSFGFNGSRPAFYGVGLAFHLNRLTDKNWKFSGFDNIEHE